MSKRVTIAGRAFLGVMIAFALEAQAEDWPHFLGPRASGISTETNLSEEWPTHGPPVVWQKGIGTGYSAPSVRDGLLVLHHRIKEQPLERIDAFDAATGAPKWKHAYPSEFVDPYGYNNGPRCTPLLTSNRCYTFGAEGRLVCTELATGKVIWERDTAKERSEEHTSELQSQSNLVCRLLLEKKKKKK